MQDHPKEYVLPGLDIIVSSRHAGYGHSGEKPVDVFGGPLESLVSGAGN